MSSLVPMEARKKIHHGALIHTWEAASFFGRFYCAWRIFIGATWMLRRGEIFAWTDDDYDSVHHENARLRRALDLLGVPAQATKDPEKAPPLRITADLAKRAIEAANND
jgi:hypothetical protein